MRTPRSSSCATAAWPFASSPERAVKKSTSAPSSARIDAATPPPPAGAQRTRSSAWRHLPVDREARHRDEVDPFDVADDSDARHAGSVTVMDEGLPIAYEVLERGVPVYASGGEQVGTVDHVVAAPEEDIFHGIVMQRRERPAFRRRRSGRLAARARSRPADRRRGRRCAAGAARRRAGVARGRTGRQAEPVAAVRSTLSRARTRALGAGTEED